MGTVKVVSVSKWIKTVFGKVVEMSNLVNGDEATEIIDCEVIDVSPVLEMLVDLLSYLMVLCITLGGVVVLLKCYRVAS